LAIEKFAIGQAAPRVEDPTVDAEAARTEVQESDRG